MEQTHERGMEQQEKSRVNVGPAERKASIAGGTALALSGITALAKRKPLAAVAMLAAGSAMIYRGATGHCSMYAAMGVDTAHEGGIRVSKRVTVNRPVADVYGFWKDLANLPRFMRHLESVSRTGDRTTHWVALGPGGIKIEWDAETTEDRPNDRICWHSTGDAQVANEGCVIFSEAPGGRGTEVAVELTYLPPGGAAGRVAGEMVNFATAQQIEEDLKRFKQVLETGEIATAQLH